MRKNLPAISIILIFILAALSYWFLWPKYLKFKDLELELERKEAVLKQKEEYFAKLTNLSLELEKRQQEFDKIDIALPQKISEPELLNFLQKRAIENGLTLKNIVSSVSFTKGEKGLSEISFSLELSGFYPYFKNYLLDIYRNSRLFELKSISFSSPAGSSTPVPLSQQGPPVFTFKVNMSAYYLSN